MSPIKNPTTFFSYLRRAPFGGRLTQAQIDGINVILSQWDYYHLTDRRWLANILAQIFHETGGRMQPVRETFASSDTQAMNRLENAWKKGDLPSVKTPYWRDGHFGRGFIQITHERNYWRLGKRLGLELVTNPTKALDPVISARIAIVGMTEGIFTGKRLPDYFSDTVDDPVNARRIVNGTDKAKLIAGYHKNFLDAIDAASEEEELPDVSPALATADDVPPAASGSVKSLIGGTVGTAVASGIVGINNPWAFGITALLLLLGAGAVYMFASGRWSVNRLKEI
ncbi:glycoside hydrolase family 19 protein [Phyllobacterium leguminum]|uniref:Chitinase class I n=1 Tax=Phyllobacterium leguminum TaxID=314237 RepID=A0A318T3U5_9HYPH|nr:glycoside hydrolase family 19 protein [Phyllobacterium leguminum]PYE87521.1 chitinase class I [Phyllobacterium leguminum]